MRVIGTAGHVDHGKSALIAALTGVHPDRLKEEREREMTIDLGFGWLTLPNGEEVGIVGMRDKLKELNETLESRFGVTLAARTGVNTGEVVALDDPTADQKLATGDAVNVTARLEQAAGVL